MQHQLSPPRPHVLFVDDEPNVLAALRRMLGRRARWQISVAHSAAEALDVLRGRQIDVVVSDLHMPGTDGAALLRHVRDGYPRTTRAVLSAETDETALLRAAPLAHLFLAKPCTEAEIVDALDLLSGRPPARSHAEPAHAAGGRLLTRYAVAGSAG